MTKYALVLLATLVTFSLFAQRPQFGFRDLSKTTEINAQQLYTDILQDRYGYIQIAGFGNPVQFDGTDFIIRNTRNFRQIQAMKMLEDPAGRIWSWGYRGHLSYQENGVLFDYPFNDTVRAMTKGQLFSFYVDTARTVHLGCRHTGYHTIDSTGQVHQVVVPTLQPGYAIAPVGDRLLSFGTGTGSRKQPPTVQFLDEQLNSMFQFPLYGADTANSLYINDGRFFQAIRLHNGRYLVNDEHMVVEFDLQRVYHRYHTPKRIIGLMEDSDGGIWIGTAEKGLEYLPQGLAQPERREVLFSEFSATVLEEDQDGGLWLKVDGMGVLYLPERWYRYFSQENGLLRNDLISSMCRGPDGIYFMDSRGWLYATDGDSLLNVDEMQYLPFRKGPAWEVLYQPQRNRFWVLGYRNLWFWDCANPGWQEFPLPEGSLSGSSRVLALSEDGHILWVGMGNNLLSVSESTARFHSKRLPAYIRKLWPIDGSECWIGCDEGLFQVLADTLIDWGAKSDRLDKPIDVIHRQNGRLWVCTKDELIRMEDDRIVPLSPNEHGHRFGMATSLLPVGDRLLLRSQNGYGLLSLTGSGADDYAFQPVPFSQEFMFTNYLHQESWGENVILANQNGVAVFRLDHVRKKPLGLPKTHIQRVWINDRDTLPRAEYQLNHDQNFLRFQYAGISYRSTVAKSYFYKLEGLEDTWKTSRVQTVQYTNLDPGEYRFVIKSVNRGNPIFGEPVSISFTIAQPWWETWWFYTICAVVGFGIIILLFLLRGRQLRKRAAKDRELDRSRHQAMTAQLNPHFMFNSLNSIYYYAKNKEDQAVETYLLKFSRLMRQVLNNSESDLVTIDQELKAVGDYLELEQMRLNHKFDYTVHIAPDVRADTWILPPLLVQPFVENAVKHGILHLAGHGKIELSVLKKADHLEIRVRDNGVGREASRQFNGTNNASLGMALNNRRIDLINSLYKGQFTIQVDDLVLTNGEPGGTEVVISFPVIDESPF